MSKSSPGSSQTPDPHENVSTLFQIFVEPITHRIVAIDVKLGTLLNTPPVNPPVAAVLWTSPLSQRRLAGTN